MCTKAVPLPFKDVFLDPRSRNCQIRLTESGTGQNGYEPIRWGFPQTAPYLVGTSDEGLMLEIWSREWHLPDLPETPAWKSVTSQRVDPDTH